MSQYVSREAPVPGSSMSEAHHGFWQDYVEREKHIYENWYNEYGHFYYQKPSLEQPYNGPIFLPQPPVKERKYLCDGQVSQSEPMAYLRACIKERARRKLATCTRPSDLLELPDSHVAKDHGELVCFEDMHARQTATGQKLPAPVKIKETGERTFTGKMVQWNKPSEAVKHDLCDPVCKGCDMCFAHSNPCIKQLLPTADGQTDLSNMLDRMRIKSWPERKHHLHPHGFELKQCVVSRDCIHSGNGPERERQKVHVEKCCGSLRGPVKPFGGQKTKSSLQKSDPRKLYSVASNGMKGVQHITHCSDKYSAGGHSLILPPVLQLPKRRL